VLVWQKILLRGPEEEAVATIATQKLREHTLELFAHRDLRKKFVYEQQQHRRSKRGAIAATNVSIFTSAAAQ
jgi:hypothetical protein